MTKEDFILILEALNNLEENREVKKLKEKVSIFIDRHKIDEEYQENMQKLAERLKDITDSEIDK